MTYNDLMSAIAQFTSTQLKDDNITKDEILNNALLSMPLN